MTVNRIGGCVFKLGGESALFDGLVNSGLLTPVVKDIQLPQQEEDIETEQMSK